MYIIVMGTCELVSLVVQQTSTLQRRTSRGCRMASDEEESSTEERWRCRRSRRLLTLLLMVRSQIKKNDYKVTALSIMSKRKKNHCFPFSLSLSLFYLLHFEFLQHPKRKQRREVRWGFNSTRLTRRHEANLPFPCLRLINKLKYRPLKPKGSYVQVQIIFSR